MEENKNRSTEGAQPSQRSETQFNNVQYKKAEKKIRRRSFLGKIPAFCMGLIVGGVLVFGLMVSTIGFSALFHSMGNSEEINVIELEKTIEASSDLTITKVHYAGLVFDKDSKSIPTPLGDAPLPLTESSVLVAYKGTIGLGFDVSAISPTVDPETKTITIALPEIGILYDEFDNVNTKSFTLTNDIFSKDEDFASSNELIGRLKATEEASVLDNETTMTEARTNAENVIRNAVSGWEAAAGYQIVFE